MLPLYMVSWWHGYKSMAGFYFMRRADASTEGDGGAAELMIVAIVSNELLVDGGLQERRYVSCGGGTDLPQVLDAQHVRYPSA